MTPETMAIVQKQIRSFREKFGREPGPKDPLFFNPDSLRPEPFRLEEFQQDTEAAMVLAGIRPEIIYAHKKTGLILTEDNYSKVPPSALAEWEAAIQEYYEIAKRNTQ
jgi:hypothetical protein